MKFYGAWYGGSSYAPPSELSHLELFDSLKDAKNSFADRPGDSYYPCVSEDSPDDGGPEMFLYRWTPELEREIAERGKHEDIGMVFDEYPDRVLTFGKRGAVVVSRG